MEKPKLLQDLGMLYPESTSKRKEHWGIFECQLCDEKTIFRTRFNSVKSGNTKSCGCYNKKRVSEATRKHGARRHLLYRFWCINNGTFYGLRKNFI